MKIKKNKDNIKIAEYTGKISFNGCNLYCAVLKDGTRIIVSRSLANVLGRKGSGSDWEKKRKEGVLLPEYVSAEYLRDFIPENLKNKLSNPIKYQLGKNKFIQEGIEATSLSDILYVWMDADKKGALGKRQKKVAETAYILSKAISKVGVIALVDEATGFQKYRKKDALRQLVEFYVIEEARKWTKEFTDRFFEGLDSIYKNEKTTPRTRPKYYGKFINTYVYSPIEKGKIFLALKENQKKSKHKRLHQFLSQDIGLSVLRNRIGRISALLDISPNLRKFKEHYVRMEGKQQWLDLSDENSEETEKLC